MTANSPKQATFNTRWIQNQNPISKIQLKSHNSATIHNILLATHNNEVRSNEEKPRGAKSAPSESAKQERSTNSGERKPRH